MTRGTAVFGRRGIAAAGMLAIAASILLLALKTPLDRNGWRRQDLNDYTLNLLQSRQVAGMESYPPGFTYPPPSVLYRLAIGTLGFPLGGGLWIALELVSAALVFVWSVELAGIREPLKKVAAAGTAYAVLHYVFEFELKYLNCNLQFLALALLGWRMMESRRAAAAGAAIAASIALKLYSALLVPWMFWTRRWKAGGFTLLFALSFFVVLPVAVWGPAKAWRISEEWRRSVAATSAPDFPETFQAYLVSLHSLVLVSFQAWTGEPSHQIARTATQVGYASWLVFCIVAGSRILGNTGLNARSDATAFEFLLLAPLPLSPQLQPHHLIVLLPSAVVFAGVVVDSERKMLHRGLYAAVLATSFLLFQFGPPRPLRAISILAVIGLFAMALWVEGAFRRWQTIRDE